MTEVDFFKWIFTKFFGSPEIFLIVGVFGIGVSTVINILAIYEFQKNKKTAWQLFAIAFIVGVGGMFSCLHFLFLSLRDALVHI